MHKCIYSHTVRRYFKTARFKCRTSPPHPEKKQKPTELTSPTWLREKGWLLVGYQNYGRLTLFKIYGTSRDRHWTRRKPRTLSSGKATGILRVRWRCFGRMGKKTEKKSARRTRAARDRRRSIKNRSVGAHPRAFATAGYAFVQTAHGHLSASARPGRAHKSRPAVVADSPRVGDWKIGSVPGPPAWAQRRPGRARLKTRYLRFLFFFFLVLHSISHTSLRPPPPPPPTTSTIICCVNRICRMKTKISAITVRGGKT